MNALTAKSSKNNNSIFFVIAAVALLVSLGFSYKMYSRWRTEQVQNEVAEFYAMPSPAVAPAVSAPALLNYSSPVVGMDFSDFSYLCGQPDDIRTFQDKRGETITYEYIFSDARGKNSCYGTFTFTDYKLSSIYRN